MRRKKFLAVLLAALLVLAALPTMASAAPVYDVVGVEVVDGTDGWTPVTAPEAGQKLTANIYTTNPDEPAIGSYPVNENARYKWYYKESPDTVLGTEAVYTATADNTNKTLCVEVSVNGYNGKAVWEAPGTVRYNVTGVEVVDGTDGYTPVVIPKDDQKLIANIKTDDPDNAVIGSYPANENAQYKWYYKESPDTVLGTEAVYTATTDNFGKTLCVEVSVNGYTGTAVWEAPNTVGDKDNYDITGIEVVDGTDGYTSVTIPKSGQKLLANIKTGDPDNAVIGSYPANENAQYKWYYKESPDTVLGTGAYYTVTTDNTNKTLCVEVSVNGYNGKAVWEASAKVPYNVTGVEVVDGTDGYTPVTAPQNGQKLTANIKTDDPDNAVIGSYPANENAQYKWYYKESPDAVLGTEATYTVTEDNVDKVLCVEVSVNGYTGTAVWKADSVVTKPVYRILGAAVVEKDGVTPVTVPQVGDILTANIITSDFEDPVIGAYPINKNAKYRWHYEDSDNVLGTDPVYTVTSDNVGKTLCVEVSVAGYSGSAVWTAKGAVEEVSVVIPGDVNKDGLVDLLDMIQINNVINEEAEFDADAFKAADINADGLLDLLDMIQVNNIINSNI